MKNFINPEDLEQLEQVILIDVRQDLQDPNYGRNAYETEHLENAFYLSLEEDLSGPVTPDTGNHPLPEQSSLKARLQEIGASNDSILVVYDEGSNFTAARGWFVLKYYGLENVFVLNGGFAAAKEAGVATSTEIPTAQKSWIDLSETSIMVADYEEIKTYAESPKDGQILIDSRAPERYRGEVEPLYDKAGHIPGAVNYFYMDNYDEHGRLRSGQELEERFAGLKGKSDIIVSCGSGVTACANYIALEEIGLKPRLYVGSYSQWLKKGNEVE
ncbi:sulfurtransferase [Clostridiaceae bacterium HFYG-1003]|nr:sulfurtransferase [Clostridiaceae bacterium HFYG-1003]